MDPPAKPRPFLGVSARRGFKASGLGFRALDLGFGVFAFLGLVFSAQGLGARRELSRLKGQEYKKLRFWMT